MKIKKISFALVACFMSLICGMVYCLPGFIQSKQVSYNATIRTIEVGQQKLDFQSLINEYEDSDFSTSGSITTFEGVKTFDLSDFTELDLVSQSDNNESLKLRVKYNYAYDSELKIVTLTATMIGEDDCSLVDTMIGVPFVDENGNFDAVFDCDGECILLSELKDAGMIANCGWFKNLIKKATKAVKTVVTAVQSAAETVKNFVYENADVIVPFAIGVIGGLTGGAAVPVLLAGAAAGAIIDGAKTAVESYNATGQVDWAATGISAGIGAAVGLIATYTGYSIGSALRPETNQYDSKEYSSYSDFKQENGSANDSVIKYGNSGTSGKFEWHHIVEQNQIGNCDVTANKVYSTSNTISLGYDTHRQISSIYSTNIENLGKYNVNGLEQAFSNVQKGQTVREYMSTLSYSEQFRLGIEILRLLGVNI